jgi:hypothetical protein
MGRYRPQSGFSRYLIPGSPGRVEAEYTLSHAPAQEEGGQPSRRAMVLRKVGPIRPFGKKRHPWPTIQFYFPSGAIYPATRPKRTGKIDETAPPSKGFVERCEEAGERLGIITGDGESRYQDFVVFAAAFAAENGHLWSKMRDVDPGEGEAGAQLHPRIKIWFGLEKALSSLSASSGISMHNIVRAAAAWLYLSLDRLTSGKKPIDLRAKEFFSRFTSGKNLRAAQRPPNFNRFKRQFMARPQESPYESEGELVGEMMMKWETVVMEAWQAKRRQLLKWPERVRTARAKGK